METKANSEMAVEEMKLGIIYAPFNKGLKTLEESSYEPISLPQNALLRIQDGKNSYASKNGNWTREGVIYVPNKGVFLTKNSPIMENPVEATQADREGRDFYLGDEQVKKALEDSVKIPENIRPIPTNRFAEDEITNYSFEEVSGEYGQFLREAGIEEMPIWIANLQDEPFAKQIWLGDLNYWSVLNGKNMCLHYNGRLHGVKELNENIN